MPWLACEGEWISSWAFALCVEIPMDPEAKSIAGGLQCCKLATTGSGWVSFPSEEQADKVAYCMQGWHGEDLAPHLLQWAARGPRGAPCAAHWGAPQPQGQPREDDPDHVWDLQCARHVRGHPGCAVPVRLWPHHWYRARLRRWCHPYRWINPSLSSLLRLSRDTALSRSCPINTGLEGLLPVDCSCLLLHAAFLHFAPATRGNPKACRPGALRLKPWKSFHMLHSKHPLTWVFRQDHLGNILSLPCAQCPSMRGTRCRTPSPGWTWLGATWRTTWWRSWPSAATPSPPQPSVKSCVTSRRSWPTWPSTTSRSWPPQPPPPPSRSRTSCPTARCGVCRRPWKWHMSLVTVVAVWCAWPNLSHLDMVMEVHCLPAYAVDPRVWLSTT